MALFNLSDLTQTPSAPVNDRAAGLRSQLPAVFASSEQTDFIKSKIDWLKPGECCYFLADGAWSNIELLEYILNKTGPANVYFTTYAISADAITRFAAWHEDLAIIDLWVILDTGFNNRKPEVYQQATGVFKFLRTRKCHAKVTVIENEHHHIVLMGSANYTKNPRLEAGIIIWDKAIAEENIKWILEEFQDV